MHRNRTLLAAVCLSLVAAGAFAVTDTVLILHTNDIHDHVRPAYDGLGGLPYVSGWIKHVRSERPDTLVLDGGDVMHKGDMAAAATNSDFVYMALGRIPYDAGAPGNHDVTDGLYELEKHEQLCGFPLLCLNMVDEQGAPRRTASKMFDVDGVKVGVVGLTVWGRSDDVLPLDPCAQALAEEVERLDREAHLIVVLCHLTSRDCAAVSERVPAADVFVGGHSHEVLEEPIVVEQTGALIVQAGCYARYVGNLELVVDLNTEEIVSYTDRLVRMDHDEVPCDAELLAWAQAHEIELCPRAAQALAHCDAPLERGQMAKLEACALHQMAGTDVSLCDPRRTYYALHEGAVDGNALFMVSRRQGQPVVTASLTGLEILACIESAESEQERPEWMGFEAEVDYARPLGERIMAYDLDLDRQYRVVMPRLVWDATVVPALQRLAGDNGKSSEALPTPEETDFRAVDALIAYFQAIGESGQSVNAHVETLSRATTGVVAVH